MNQILSTENNYKKQDREKGEILDTRKNIPTVTLKEPEIDV